MPKLPTISEVAERMRRVHTPAEVVKLEGAARAHLRDLLETGAEIRTSHFCCGAGPKEILRNHWISYRLRGGEGVVERGTHGLAIVGSDGKPRVLFEVVYTREGPTTTPRPEPWYALPAEFVLDPNNLIRSGGTGVGAVAMFQSVRQHPFPCKVCAAMAETMSADAKACPWCGRWALKDAACNYIFGCGYQENGAFEVGTGCGKPWCWGCGRKFCGLFVDPKTGQQIPGARTSHDAECCRTAPGFREEAFCGGGHNSHCEKRW